jgi:hypothetical protein
MSILCNVLCTSTALDCCTLRKTGQLSWPLIMITHCCMWPRSRHYIVPTQHSSSGIRACTHRTRGWKEIRDKLLAKDAYRAAAQCSSRLQQQCSCHYSLSTRPQHAHLRHKCIVHHTNGTTQRSQQPTSLYECQQRCLPPLMTCTAVAMTWFHAARTSDILAVAGVAMICFPGCHIVCEG